MTLARMEPGVGCVCAGGICVAMWGVHVCLYVENIRLIMCLWRGCLCVFVFWGCPMRAVPLHVSICVGCA